MGTGDGDAHHRRERVNETGGEAKVLRGLELQQVLHLVAPSHRPLLIGGTPGLEAVAWMPTDEDPRAVAVRIENERGIEVFSINADSTGAARGDGTHLLRWLKNDAIDRHRMLEVELVDDPSLPIRPLDLFREAGMPSPTAIRLMVTFGEKMYRATLSEEAATNRDHPIGSWRSLPPDFRIVGWCECSEPQREDLRARREDLQVYREVDPFDREFACEERTSLAILRGDQIVGWLISHIKNDGVLRQTVSYIDPRLQRFGLIYPAYVELIRRITTEIGFDMKMRFTVDLEHARGLAAVVKRRWAPFADAVNTCWRSACRP